MPRHAAREEWLREHGELLHRCVSMIDAVAVPDPMIAATDTAPSELATRACHDLAFPRVFLRTRILHGQIRQTGNQR